LVYCLPAGALVDSTAELVRTWLSNLAKAYSSETLAWLAENSPVCVAGAEAEGAWDCYPEKEAILIGTQDRLLSRALNRGFGQSPYRWPMHFALLNHDALWVMDEPELMGVGLETSVQLEAFRPADGMAPCRTWWMGATLAPDRLETVDHSKPASGWKQIGIGSDLDSPVVKQRLQATKWIARADFVLGVGAKGSYPKSLVRFIRDRHVEDELTLVVVSTVERAQAVWQELVRRSDRSGLSVGLLHESLLPQDRARSLELMRSEGGRIVITTPSVEAGLDVSARVLVTELAPWPALVQRLGRCNRYGEHGVGDVFWIDGRYDKNDLAKPYAEAELDHSRKLLLQVSGAGSATLKAVPYQRPRTVFPVLRHKDLLDLFDTTPDLCGSEVDVSSYVAEPERGEVLVFWRAAADPSALKKQPGPRPEELCRVSLAAFDRFIKANAKLFPWQWDWLAGCWQRVTQGRAGATYLIPVACGGYLNGVGWTGNSDDKPALPVAPAGMAPESYDENRDSFTGNWKTLDDHTDEVIRSVQALAAALDLPERDRLALVRAARWHDVGKAHPEFQRMLRHGAAETPSSAVAYAQANNSPRSCRRLFFRHELASALAWLAAAPAAEPDRDLIAYLIAAHHGRVSMSLRGLPDEPSPLDDPDRLCSRGVWDGETLPKISLAELPSEPLRLDLSLMRLGGGPTGRSWVSRMIALRNRSGVFELAVLGLLLRVADLRSGRGSREMWSASTDDSASRRSPSVMEPRAVEPGRGEESVAASEAVGFAPA
jgi:CRISPR-associated endonuclease/helicase Cas3